MRWKQWQIDIQSKIDAKYFVSEKHLDLIMRVSRVIETYLFLIQLCFILSMYS